MRGRPLRQRASRASLQVYRDDSSDDGSNVNDSDVAVIVIVAVIMDVLAMMS